MIIKAEGKMENWKMKAMYADAILASQKINYEPKEPMDKRGHGKDGRARSSGRVFF
jgi:hypothetical protein